MQVAGAVSQGAARGRRAAASSISTRSPVTGWSNAIRHECRNGRVRPRRGRVVPAAPVRAVPEDRVADRAQVHADLVGPAGARRRLEQRRAGQPLADLEPRLGRPALAVGPRRCARPGGRGARRRRTCRAPPGRGRAPGSGVRPRGAASSRASASCASSVFATSISPDVPASSRCTMPGRSGPPFRDSGDAHAEQAVHERAGAALLRGVGDQARRLRDHQQVRRPRSGPAPAGPPPRAVRSAGSRPRAARRPASRKDFGRAAPSTST